MDFMKMKVYVELLVVAVAITSLVYVVPVSAYLGTLKPVSAVIDAFIWALIWRYNSSFHELVGKWQDHVQRKRRK
ncbi:hypothetical protein [Priestia koreensis]|uniref:Uncharacterized protein n=1 Tax=Priestia koreensis TaxID=284581 RepID=A0A0M0L9W0_9BACI|nr:hypothetical protein [Priestia koreensis]KOO47637.1 hypothetical protein AMD01_06275 [Priestia koreensis]MCM3006252.1 hypothetical protein [Priestia koreensis]